jgi:DNA-binding LacI/PurR family transcriptional regulator
MREPSVDRRQRILAAVQSRGAARVSELATELEVSVVTVRRDVEQLARAGRLRRGHGVARSVVPVQQVPEADGSPAPGGAVAIVVPERHAYLNEVVHGARIALEEAGMQVVLHIAPQRTDLARADLERILSGAARGLLIAPRWRSSSMEDADHGWLAEAGVPTVLMERRPRAGSALHVMDSVCSDHWYGVHLAVEHLVSMGHRRVVLAARDDSPTARAVRSAFAEIAAARPEVEDWSVVLSAPDAGPDPDDPPLPPLQLAGLLRERGATAALLHGDVEALMLVQQLAEHGMRVPADCSVVAYNDVVAALGSPPLTAVAPPKAEVGRAAAELLMQRLATVRSPGGWRPCRVELLPELKIRGSTAPLSV